MKKIRTDFIQLLILLALGVGVILTLVLPGLGDSRPRQSVTSISVILRDTDTTLWSNTRLGMEQAAGELRVELRFLTLSQTNDAAQQLRLMTQELEQGANALVVVPASDALPGEDLPTGAVVVSLESLLPGAATVVSPDNDSLGRQLAQAAASDWKSGPVLLVQTAPENAAMIRRLAAARQSLEAAGVPVTEVTCTAADLETELEALVTASGARQVMTFEPSATVSAAAAKEKLSLPAELYGVGATGRIAAWLEQETIAAVAAWSEFAAGYLAVERAVQTLDGQSYGTETLPFTILRGEDMYEPDNQKLLFPVMS